MENHEQIFTPEQIDEQIERHLDDLETMPEARFLSEMQQIAGQIREEQGLSLRRVEDHLMNYSRTQVEFPVATPSELKQQGSSPFTLPQGSFERREKKQASKFGWRVNMLVAVLVTAVLVGSLVTLLSFAHRRTTMTGHGQVATPPSTLTSRFGKTLSTTSNSRGFTSVAFSSDSKRIAAITDHLQIWDAPTGRNAVTVLLPAGTVPFALAWSPVSNLVAVGTNRSLLVVNGQTGVIVHSYPYSLASGSVNTSAGDSFLSTQVSISDGLGFGTPVWSPDGKLIAATIFVASWQNKILVWNPQTNAVAFEITGSSSTQDTRVAAWSPDGQYLAGMIFNVAIAPAEPPSYVVAWKVSTRQIVFKDKLASKAMLQGPTWQPHSDNLAFGQLNLQPLSASPFEVWNVLTGRRVMLDMLEISSVLSWSPDGKYLAYVSNSVVSWVNIIDVNSGQQIYTYKGHAQSSNYIATLAWSPNGKYIASGEGQTPVGKTTPTLKVWTAE